MATKGKGKQVAGKAPAAAADSSSGKRKVVRSEDPGGRRKRRRRRPGVLQFFDDAAVDGESDRESDEDLEMEEDRKVLDDGKLENKNLREAGKSHHLPFFVKEEEFSGDELEELIKDRYSHGSEYVMYNDDSVGCHDKVSEADEMKDVIIWRVKCMVGRERQVAFCFMQKYIELDNLGTKLQIISAFALEHVKGYVFVEAAKLSDVTEACKGFCSVYSSRINLVPRSELPHLLATRNNLSEVSKGTWVRMRSGKYKGDLAKVVAADDGRKRVTVKLVPRIDLQAIAKKFGGGVSLKLAAVPAPRMISSHELETFRPHIELRRDRQTGELFEVLDGMMLKDGYLYKKVSIGSLIFYGVQPSSSELLMFSDATKDMDEDLDWVASIYSARKKGPLAESSNEKVSALTKNGYSLHDLILFGRKSFGVIVAVEKDCFKILKGDVKGAEVVTAKIQDIKNSCVDKMFTALDQNRKTIFINDIVKILSGPSEGREGVVRHMYKGTLFIQVENETENSGFFCAKSESCEKTKELKDFYGANLRQGKQPIPSFPQSPIRTYDQENDNARGSTRCRQSDNEQMFSIGQTLRIREGPLKGYLCHVVGIYRSDVTVKLDSLVKLITVKDKSLAVPKIKGNNSAAISSDHVARSPNGFGTREVLSIASPSFGGTSTQAEKSSWDSVVSLFNRDFWQAFSISKFSVACNNENQTGRDDEPWGNKLVSVTEAVAGGSDRTMDDWAKQPGSCTGHEADPWGNMVKSTANRNTGGSNDSVDEWGKTAGSITGQGLGADPCSKAACAERTEDGWGKPSNSCVLEKAFHGVSDQAGNCEKNSDDWNRKALVEKANGRDGWEKSKLSISDAMGTVKINIACSWDSKGKQKIDNEEDDWGKAAKSQEKINDGWDAAAACWTQSNDNACSWDNKGKGKINSDEDNWGRATKSQGRSNDSWNAASVSWNQCTAKLSHWDDAKVPSASQSDSWVQAKEKNGAEIGSSNGARVFSLGQDCGRDKQMSTKGNHDSSWHKGVDSEKPTANDHMENWNKHGNFQGMHGLNANDNENRSQGGNWNKNCDGGQTSSWERGRQQIDEDGGHRNHENNWSRQRDFDGDRGSSWGRGRGRHGARGSMGPDAGDQEEKCSSGWRGGRGRGRGRGHHGEARGRRDDFDETRPFGQVCNWVKDHATTQTTDWKNQQSCGDESITKDPKSTWENDKNAGWDKLKKDSGNEGSSGNTNQVGTWSKSKSFDAHCSSVWNSLSRDVDSGMDATGMERTSSWEEQVSIPKEGSSKWEKPHTGEKSVWSKDDTNKWSSTSSGWEGDSFEDVPGAQENLHMFSPRGTKGNSQNTSSKIGDGNKPGWDKWSSRDGDMDTGGSEWDSVKASDVKQLSGWTECTSAGVEAGGKTITGDWDKPRADDPCKSSNFGSGISSWDGAASSDEKGKGISLCKSSDWTHPKVVSSDKIDSWDIKGKGRVATEDCWGTTTNPQERKTDEANNWGGNTSQSKESTTGGRNQTGSWDAAVLHSTETVMVRSYEVSSWKKANSEFDKWKMTSQTDETETRGWNQSRSFKRSENDNWDRLKSFGEEAGRNDQIDSWNTTREGDRGFGRGRWRGQSNRDSGNDFHNSSWNKPMDDGGDQRSIWGRGRGGNNKGGDDQQRKWNRQGDFDGARGSSWGRGRGRFGTRGRSQGDNSSGPPNQESSWSGRGRGRGNNNGNNFDMPRPSSGTGCQGPGRGRFFSSERKNDQENSGDGTFPRNSISVWGNDENKGWSSNWSKDEADNASNCNKKENKWGRTKESSGGQSSAWDKWST